MKLLIYSHFFAPSIGGVETIVLSQAQGLAGLRDAKGIPRFEVSLVTQTPADGFNDNAFPFAVIRRPSLFRIWRLVRSSDVIHVAGPALIPLLLGLVLRKPTVVEHHGFQAICPNGQLLIEPSGTPCPGHFMAARHLECLRCNSGRGWLASFKLWLLAFVRRFLCTLISGNIAPTKWLAGLLELPRTTAIPHGLDLHRIAPRSDRTSGKPVIAFVGRLVTTKGVHLLLEAAQILQKEKRLFEMLIIGDGPERIPLEQSTQNLELETKVHFAGRLSEHQLEALLTQAYAVVVPSLGGEVFGLVLAENMARALPVIAADLGAFAEVLGGTGLLFRAGESTDLARALSRVLDDPSLSVTLGLCGRERVFDFCDKSRMIDKHARVYFDLSAARID